MRKHFVVGLLLLLLMVYSASAAPYVNAYINSTYLTIDNTPAGAAGPALLIKTITQNMVVDANGNVGIGTTTPASRFVVNESIQPTYKGLFSVGGSVVSLKEQNPAQSHFPYIEWRNASNDRGAYLGWGNNQGTTRYLELTLENGHRFYIGGNVTIGTTSPPSPATLYVTNAAGGDSIAYGSGGITYPDNPYPYTTLVGKGTTSDYRTEVQDGGGRVSNLWNAYTNQSGLFKYIVSTEAAGRVLMSVNNGAGLLNGSTIVFFSAPTGTAGGTITWNQTAYFSTDMIQLTPRGTTFPDLVVNGTSGNVGIGTTAPLALLDAVGTGTNVASTTYAVTISEKDHTTYPGVFLGYDSSGQIGVIGGATATIASNLAFWTYSGAAWGERMRINSAGNVGIGTSAPTQKLDVNGNVNISGAGYIAGSQICTATNGICSAGGGSWTISGTNISNSNTGNVGIGTASPTAQLQLFSATHGGDLGIGQQNDVTPYMRLGMDNAWNQYLANNAYWTGAAYNYVNTGGYSGTATAIHQVSGTISFDTASGGVNPITWNQRVFITNAGNVGIGTNAPNQKLNVIGHVNITGGVYASSNVNTAGRGQTDWYNINTGSIGAWSSIYSYGPICASNAAGDCSGAGGVVIGSNNVNAYSNIPYSGNTFFGGNVGIGTTGPTQKLQITGGNILLDNASGSVTGNLYFGGQTQNGMVGMRLFGGTLGGGLQGGYIDAMATTATEGLKFRVDSAAGGTERMRITAAGNVGIANSNPQYVLDVGGLAHRADNSNVWTVASDVRLKENITTLNNSLELLGRLRGVTFDWKNQSLNTQGKTMGFIAQEVETVFPQWVQTGSNGYKTVTTTGMDALLVNGVNDLNKKTIALQNENDALRQENQELHAAICRISPSDPVCA